VSAALPREGRIEGGVHLYPVRVYWEDTDAGGIVYYANYLRFAERARTELLRRSGIHQERQRREGGPLFVVRRCAAEFLAAARLDDDLVVATRIERVGAATLDLDQEVRREGAPLVRLKLQIACLGQRGRPTRLPATVRTALANLNDNARMVTTHAR
jgi:acyl-CoA thioester hydrolase